MVVAQITDTLKQPKGLICFKDTYEAYRWGFWRRGLYRITSAWESITQAKAAQ